MALATLTIDMVAKLGNIERDLGRIGHLAEQNARQMASAFDGAGRSIAKAFAQIAGPLVSIETARQLFLAVHEATLQAEKSQLRLSGALKATGHAAGLTKNEIEGLSLRADLPHKAASGPLKLALGQ